MMKEDLLTAARILSFCIPFSLIFLAVDYHLADEQLWQLCYSGLSLSAMHLWGKQRKCLQVTAQVL